MVPDSWQTQVSRNNTTIPNGWCHKRLSEVSDIRPSNVDKKSIPGEVNVRLCNYLDVYNNDYITDALDFMEATAGREEIARFTIEPGDVIITKDSETPDDIGVPAVSLSSVPNLVCGYHLTLIKPNREQIEPVFLAGQIAHERISRYFTLHAHGSTRFGLTISTIANTPLWLPPLPEQRRIAEILDAADEAIRATERVIAKLRQIKAGLLHDLLTRGLDAQGRLRDPVAYLAHCHPEERSDEGSRFPRTGHLASLGMSECGWRDLSRSWGMECKYPSDWLVLSLAEVTAKFIGGGTPSTSVPEYWDGTIPWITGADAEQKIATTSRKYVTERGIKESSTCIVPEGNILLVTRTGVGKVSIAGVDIAISQDLTGVVLDREVIDASYLYRQLKYLGRELQRLSQGTIIQGIKREEVEELPIPVPPLAEQRRIAAILDAHDARLRAEEAALAKLRQVKRGLMDDLLTGKVRV